MTLPEGLSAEQHLCHTTLCLESIICNHQLMKFRVSESAAINVISIIQSVSIDGSVVSLCIHTVGIRVLQRVTQEFCVIVGVSRKSQPCIHYTSLCSLNSAIETHLQ